MGRPWLESSENVIGMQTILTWREYFQIIESVVSPHAVFMIYVHAFWDSAKKSKDYKTVDRYALTLALCEKACEQVSMDIHGWFQDFLLAKCAWR